MLLFPPFYQVEIRSLLLIRNANRTESISPISKYNGIVAIKLLSLLHVKHAGGSPDHLLSSGTHPLSTAAVGSAALRSSMLRFMKSEPGFRMFARRVESVAEPQP